MSLKDFFTQTLLRDVAYGPEEKTLEQFDPVTVESVGRGPESTTFPKCRIIITTDRMIIAQKILWSSKYKVHYFVWLNTTGDRKALQKGVLHLRVNKADIVQEKSDLLIFPDDSLFITRLVLKNFANSSDAVIDRLSPRSSEID